MMYSNVKEVKELEKMSSRRYKVGRNRQQTDLLPPSLEEYVSATNVVRAIDAYVDSLDLVELGFSNTKTKSKEGQPAYPPSMLLKLYLYGYMNRVRSSRRLEREAKINVELMWLFQTKSRDNSEFSQGEFEKQAFVRNVS